MEATTATPARPGSLRLEQRDSQQPDSTVRRWLERKWALSAYLFINAPLIAGLLLMSPPADALLRALIPALTVTALVVGIRSQRPPATTAWWLITAAVAGTTGGYLVGAVTRTAFALPPPEWVGPVLAALTLPLLIAGLAVLGRHGGGRDTADMLDATVIAMAAFVVLFALVIHPVLPPGTSAIVIAAILPLGALLLFAMAVWVALSFGVPTPSIALLLLAVCFGVATTISMLVLGLSTGTPWGHPLVRVLFIGFAVLLGSAALHPSLRRTPDRLPRRHDTVSRRRIGLLAVLAVVAPVAWGGEIARTTGVENLRVTIPLLVSAVLLLLVVARLGVTAGVAQRRAAELSQRSEDLAEAVQEQEMLQRQLRHQAMHDPLTGLANRVVLAERMEWALSRPGGVQYALAVIDLDRFKDVNDAVGHALGDQVLVEASHRLLELATTPPGATVARFGGDEFAALLESASPAEARAWSEQVRQAFRRPYRIDDHDFYLSASIGLLVTQPGRPAPTPSEALRDADLALRSAKAAGKDRVEMFFPELRTARVDYRWLRTGLQRALTNDELVLHYQPVVNLTTGRIVAVEALLRWAPAGQPPLPPSAFISVAEDTGLIVPIGAWVIHRACRDARPWYDDGVAVTVNVSAHQLEDPGFADLVLDALHTGGLPGDALILEITETSLVATSMADQAMDHLNRLRAHGIRVAIDDFGTGYSSLANVARLPADIVKIDRSFVQDPGPTGNHSQRWAFARAILNMVDALHLQAVAEGVETLEQADALRQLGCPVAQGYLFAKPMPPAVFTQALSDSLVLPRQPVEPRTPSPGRTR